MPQLSTDFQEMLEGYFAPLEDFNPVIGMDYGKVHIHPSLKTLATIARTHGVEPCDYCLYNEGKTTVWRRRSQKGMIMFTLGWALAEARRLYPRVRGDYIHAVVFLDPMFSGYKWKIMTQDRVSNDKEYLREIFNPN